MAISGILSSQNHYNQRASGFWPTSVYVYVEPVTQRAIFGFGYGNVAGYPAITNLVSNTGVVATDTACSGSPRQDVTGAGYGGDKAIFGYGRLGPAGSYATTAVTNLISNTGVVASDTAGVSIVRFARASAGYGSDKAIFGFGSDTNGIVSVTNLVSNTGVVGADVTGVGSGRYAPAAAGYGTDKAIFGFGQGDAAADYARQSTTQLVSNTGVVATNTAGVGSARRNCAATGYSTDKAIFGFGDTGSRTSITSLVSNTGVVASDTAGVGTARENLAAAKYGGDKAIFAFGYWGNEGSMSNLVSNTGVVSNDVTGVGTVRQYLAAAGYSLT